MPFVYSPLWAAKIDLNPVPVGSENNYWASADAAAASGVFLQLEGNLNLVSSSLSATISSTIPTLSSSLSSTISGVAVLSGVIATVSVTASSALATASVALATASEVKVSASDLSSTIGNWDFSSGSIYDAVSQLSGNFTTNAEYVNEYLTTVAGTSSGWPATGSTYGVDGSGNVISGSMSATLDYVQRQSYAGSTITGSFLALSSSFVALSSTVSASVNARKLVGGPEIAKTGSISIDTPTLYTGTAGKATGTPGTVINAYLFDVRNSGTMMVGVDASGNLILNPITSSANGGTYGVGLLFAQGIIGSASSVSVERQNKMVCSNDTWFVDAYNGVSFNSAQSATHAYNYSFYGGSGGAFTWVSRGDMTLSGIPSIGGANLKVVGNDGYGGNISGSHTGSFHGGVIAGADVTIENSGSGLVLQSPDGHYWRVTINNAGELSSTLIS